jgi:hypothetical protein
MTHQELAEKCLGALVDHVLSHQDRTLVGITYEELARRIGFFDKHGQPQPRLGKVLGRMGHMLETIEASFPEGIPHIQALVVVKSGQNRGIPDDGIKEFWDGYDRLSRAEKENKAVTEWQHIGDFGSRWNTVLRELHLPLVPAPVPAVPQCRGRGGESPAHKALKAYIKANPQMVGVEAGADAFEEYALPSLDTLDVLFKAPTCWTAVEVKSSVSDGVPGDYERGLYQLVKYTALLKAMRGDARYAVPGAIRVILVLESSLPAALSALKARLEATVIERVRPPAIQQRP